MTVPEFSSSYIKTASHEAQKGDFKRCLLLYSGGLDTSVMVKWLQESYECEVVALTIDIGQTADDLESIRKKALSLGAVDAVIVDAKKEFAEVLLAESIKANADYQGGYALGCPLGRVIIAQVAVRVAGSHGCEVIAHGCTGKGNDQVRFESYITTLNKNLKTIAPVREWAMGRDEELAYAQKHSIPVKQSSAKPYSYDENMWSNTAEGGEIEDPALISPLEDILLWAKTPEQAEEEADIATIFFEKGIPVSLSVSKFSSVCPSSPPPALDRMDLSSLIMKLNVEAGKHGVGVFHLIEDRVLGLKVRGIYENPAAHVLIEAHRKLEKLVSTRDENEFKALIDHKWSYMVYGAKYFDPLMDHIRGFLESSSEKVEGWVRVKMYRGRAEVVALDSKNSLFDLSLATFDKDAGEFNQNASPGFIELWNLPQKTAYALKLSRMGT